MNVLYYYCSVSLTPTSWGPPQIKVGGGKGSWTGRQIGMLISYFVLIKLSVIKCLFNYDNALLS